MKKVIASIIFALSIGSSNAFASNQFAIPGPIHRIPTPFVDKLLSTTKNIPSTFGRAAFDKLLATSGVKGLQILVTNAEGSFTDQSHKIYIAKADIALCERSINCVTFIAAHEIGHNALGHTSGNEYNHKQQEKDADLYAVKLEAKAGFDPCAGAPFFDMIGKMYGNDGGSDHPNNNVRADYIRAACAKYKNILGLWGSF